MKRTLAIAGLLGTLSVAGVAAADDPEDAEDSYAVAAIPAECLPFLAIGDGASAERAWGALLSMAACVQDASVAEVRDPAELAAMVATFARRLQPAMVLYLQAVQRAPEPYPLRAVYQIGLAHVALMVRARSSIVVSADLRPNRRDRKLRADLESLLAPAAKVAWVAFAAIDQAVAEDPELAPDVVTANMVRDARVQLRLLAHDWGDEGAPPTVATAP